MASSPGLPSAHPAAYVPLTLVDGAVGATPASPDVPSAPGVPSAPVAPSPTGVPSAPVALSPTGVPPPPVAPPAPYVPSAPRVDLPPPRRPLDAALGRPWEGGSTPAGAPGCPVAVPADRGPRVGAVPAVRWRGLPAHGPAFPVAGPLSAGTPYLPPCPAPAGPSPAGVPPHLAAALNRPARPGTVTAAGVLWILVAALDALTAFAVLATGELHVVVPVLALLLGAATAVLAVAMLRGSDAARTAVTILGGVAGSVVLLPLLLFVPAVIVTLHPSSTAWFTDARRRRAALSTW